MTAHLRPAVFLDRDGTLNVERHYLHRVEDFAWIPGAPEAVRRLNEAGFVVVVVTNQAGVARGLYDEAAIATLHAHMQADLARVGARVDAFYYSPFHPEGIVEAYRRASECRKPGALLFKRAVAEHGLDAARSFAVGDRASDLFPAQSLGCRTILVETGYGREEAAHAPADAVMPDIGAAVDWILAQPVRQGR
ncbi:MAG TPA: HAD family hydrolase [Rhodothermales bacterium]|nr:HAD family hydrolase [Rhodothermales bacterium]